MVGFVKYQSNMHVYVFTAMDILDGDDERLYSNGKYAERDIVQVMNVVFFHTLFCSFFFLNNKILSASTCYETLLFSAHR